MMSEIFLEELGVPEPDHMLGVGSGSHAEQIARVMERLEPVLGRERPTWCSSPATSTRRWRGAGRGQVGIPVAHVESGLRSFDRSMPEEINRIVTDPSPTLFLHREEAIENLRAEGIADERMHSSATR